MTPPEVTPEQTDVLERQLGRPPRGLRAVVHTCTCGLPDVVETDPVLPDGTPFPTFYWLSCPRARSAVGRLEAAGVMASLTERLGGDEDLAAGYAAAHEDYLARRDAVRELPGRPGAGGMPDRVKCLHVLVAHELATGANPVGRIALDQIPDWGSSGPCVEA